jgi:hypothetical protein
MERVDAALPAEAGGIRLVLHDYGTHKTSQVIRWLAQLSQLG